MIIKSFEIEKIKSIKNNLILIYGTNQGYKNQVIKELFENLFKGEVLRFDENIKQIEKATIEDGGDGAFYIYLKNFKG